MFRPHFVRDYRRLVQTLVRQHADYDEAMAKSVGGDYESVGRSERDFLVSIGLGPDAFVVDVGAGSGRLATSLADMPSLRYLGTDVVGELLDYARRRAARADWRFEVVESLVIPADSAVADFVVFFSVFTHLTPRECHTYLREAVRVARPGARIVISYLDPSNARHRGMAGTWWQQLRLRFKGEGTKNTLLSKDTLRGWAQEFALGVEFPYDALEAGQSICLLTVPPSR